MAATTTYGDPTDVAGKRVLAWLIDFAIIAVLVIVALAATGQSDDFGSDFEAELFCEVQNDLNDNLCVNGGSTVVLWDNSDIAIALGVIPFVYVLLNFVLLQGITGFSVGKAAVGVRTVKADTLENAGIGRSLVRTLFWIVDNIPFVPLVGLITMLTGKRHQRVGDLVASTWVVGKEHVSARGVSPAATTVAGSWAPPAPPLGAPSTPPSMPPQPPSGAPAPPSSNPSQAPSYDPPPAADPAPPAWAPPTEPPAQPADVQPVDGTDSAAADPTIIDSGWTPPSSEPVESAEPASIDAAWAPPTAPATEADEAEPTDSREADSTPREDQPAHEDPTQVDMPAIVEPTQVQEPFAPSPPAAASPPVESRPGVDAPMWDEARNTYIQWDPKLQKWMGWDDTAKRWYPL